MAQKTAVSFLLLLIFYWQICSHILIGKQIEKQYYLSCFPEFYWWEYLCILFAVFAFSLAMLFDVPQYSMNNPSKRNDFGVNNGWKQLSSGFLRVYISVSNWIKHGQNLKDYTFFVLQPAANLCLAPHPRTEERSLHGTPHELRSCLGRAVYNMKSWSLINTALLPETQQMYALRLWQLPIF